MYPKGISHSTLVSHHNTALSLLLQLVKKARCLTVQLEDVWEYFSEVMAPEVNKWQGQRPQDQRTVGDIVLDFAKAAPFSKVLDIFTVDCVAHNHYGPHGPIRLLIGPCDLDG